MKQRKRKIVFFWSYLAPGNENFDFSNICEIDNRFFFCISVSAPEMGSCRIEITGDEGSFSSVDLPSERIKLVEKYQIAIDCMWIITVKEGWKVS